MRCGNAKFSYKKLQFNLIMISFKQYYVIGVLGSIKLYQQYVFEF